MEFSYKTKPWKEARRGALIRARYRCAFCGKSVAAKGASRVDHIAPVSERPDLALIASNLRVLCIDCDAARHAEKGNRTIPRQTIGLDGFPE